MKWNTLKYAVQRMGVDKAIAYSSVARIIQAVSGVVSILLIARYLTGIEQGFYYTFGSIVSIQIFFELGVNTIITQYVAHEIVHLRWQTPVELAGDSKYLSRLSSLLHFGVKWFLYFAGILFVTLVAVGFVFFDKYGGHDEVAWQLPWILLAAGASLNLLLAPVLAFIEGMGKVKEIAKIRLYQQAISIVVVCGGLMSGAKLYVSGINWLIAMGVILCILFCGDFRKLLWNIWHIPLTDRVNYRQEIFPYQWKIAVSWISGYFIFHLFNPVLFATEGAVAAGQMGITLTALNGIQNLSLSWMTTKIPLYSGLIAKKDYIQLDSVFNKASKQSVFINGVLLLIMLLIIFLIRQYHLIIGNQDVGSRFLPYFPMILMMISLFINQFTNSWTIYLRCHNQEPFLINSLVGGLFSTLSTVLLGKYCGMIGVTSGYCFIVIVLAFWRYWIFVTKKKEWHGK